MMRSLIAIVLLLLGVGAIAGEVLSIKIPCASWFFDNNKNLAFTSINGFPWFGWVQAITAILVGAWMLAKALTNKSRQDPSAVMRRERFYEVKRGVWSLWILLFLVFLASLDFLIVGNKPLAMKYEGKMYYPAFERKTYFGKDFGVEGDLADTEINFRRLKESFSEGSENWALMPVRPYDPAGDTLPPIEKELSVKNGVYVDGKGKPYKGKAARTYRKDPASDELKLHLRYNLRGGKLVGPVDGWAPSGEKVYSAFYENAEGVSVLKNELYFTDVNADAFHTATAESLKRIYYHPAPPSKKHPLGTNSNGNDVVAYLYGGLQVNIMAALVYIPLVYIIGVTIGLMMGYFGGIFDLIFQRIIEALESVPFLFVIIIVSTIIPTEMKGLWMIVTILVIFGWMGSTYLMRTAAYREKSRDYVASARVLGASTPRILRKHIFPNTIPIIVTMIPFAISGVVNAITGLDYLGFGLPPHYASWGKLLNDGLSNPSAPWLATSGFVVLVILLTLVTFVGEAVREAWDPKRHTIYK